MQRKHVILCVAVLAMMVYLTMWGKFLADIREEVEDMDARRQDAHPGADHELPPFVVRARQQTDPQWGLPPRETYEGLNDDVSVPTPATTAPKASAGVTPAPTPAAPKQVDLYPGQYRGKSPEDKQTQVPAERLQTLEWLDTAKLVPQRENKITPRYFRVGKRWIEHFDYADYPSNLFEQTVTVYVANDRVYYKGALDPVPNCKIKRCYYTNDPKYKQSADAVFYHLRMGSVEAPPLGQHNGQKHVIFGQESEKYYTLMASAQTMRNMDMTMDYRLDSDVPAGYWSWAEYNFMDPVKEKTADALAAVFVSNCNALSGRQQVMRDLQRYGVTVHSYGRCEHNREFPDGDRGTNSKVDLCRTYKFTLVFENSVANDYVTEKFFQALVSGSVPVYIGAPNIDDYAPSPHSVIKVSDFANTQELAEHLLFLDKNPAEYNKYLQWKTDGLSDRFKQLVDQATIHSHCRLCAKVGAMKLGLDVPEHPKEATTAMLLRNPPFKYKGDPTALDSVFMPEGDAAATDTSTAASSQPTSNQASPAAPTPVARAEQPQQQQQQQQQQQKSHAPASSSGGSSSQVSIPTRNNPLKLELDPLPVYDVQSAMKDINTVGYMALQDSQFWRDLRVARGENVYTTKWSQSHPRQDLKYESLDQVPETIVLAWNDASGYSAQLKQVPNCHIKCGYTSDHKYQSKATALFWHVLRGVSGDVPKRAFPEQKYVLFSMEGEGNYVVMSTPSSAETFDLSMDYRLTSDTPAAYYSWVEYDLMAPPKPKTEDALAVYFVSNCNAKNRRGAFTQELMNHIKIDSFGRCLHNRDLPQDGGFGTKIEVQQRYKFCLAFENTNTVDYVTEKFFQALSAGCVPVYMGAPNIDDFSPSPRSVIKASDFDSPKALADYLKELDADDEKYNEYLKWKFKGPSTKFMAIMDWSIDHSHCRLCMRLQNLSLKRYRQLVRKEGKPLPDNLKNRARKVWKDAHLEQQPYKR